MTIAELQLLRRRTNMMQVGEVLCSVTTCQKDECKATGACHASLCDELAELRKDAERYRWLRDVGDETWVPMGKRPGVNFTHEIDQAIDAAIARTKAVGAA